MIREGKGKVLNMLFATSTVGTVLAFICCIPGNLMILRGILNWGDVTRGIKYVLIGLVLLFLGAVIAGGIAKLIGAQL